jgi:hypothetical protein
MLNRIKVIPLQMNWTMPINRIFQRSWLGFFSVFKFFKGFVQPTFATPATPLLH